MQATMLYTKNMEAIEIAQHKAEKNSKNTVMFADVIYSTI